MFTRYLVCSNHLKTRSARGCYLCSRYVLFTYVSGPDPEISGAPGETRTPDPLLRRQTLYPTELRAHGAIYFTIKHLQLLLGKLQF